MTGYPEGNAGLFITSLASLFVIVSPLGNIFSFMVLSAGYAPKAKILLARRACVIAYLILTGFLVVGRAVMEFLGISLAAFQIAGGVLLFRIALDMLEGREAQERRDSSASLKAEEYRDIAVVPLAIPLLSGPGALTTILMLPGGVRHPLDWVTIWAALTLVMAATYIIFRFAAFLAAVLKETGVTLATRLMGLILAALAAQFTLDGLQSVWHWTAAQ